MVYVPDPIRLGNNVLMASAIVRLDINNNGTPNIYLHEDGAHARIGVDYALVYGRNVRVVTRKPVLGDGTYAPVISAFAFPDETIAVRKGVSMGISGGGPGSDVWFYSNKLDRRLSMDDDNDYALVAHTYSNIWFEIKWYVPC